MGHGAIFAVSRTICLQQQQRLLLLLLLPGHAVSTGGGMFVEGIAFVSFNDVERVLSAIAKFLVYLLGKWEEWYRRRGGGEGKV